MTPATVSAARALRRSVLTPASIGQDHAEFAV
jgi:hypothetical protein